MKKKLSLTIVSLMCLGVLGLQSCNETSSIEATSETTSETTSEATSVVDEVVYTAVSITNKDELQATWLLEEADRTVDLSVEPTANTLALLNDGTIVITSSDSSVISVSGKKLTAVASGSATITVTLTDGDTVLTDTVDLTVEAAAAPLTIAEVRALTSGDLAKTRGYITKIMGDNSFAIIADGETSIELYGFYDYADMFAVGDLVLASGTYSPYNGLSEIGSLTAVDKIDAADNADVLAPVDLEVTDWAAIGTGMDCRIVNVEGMVFNSLGTADSKGNFYIYLSLNDVDVSCYVSYHNDATALAEIYALFEATPLTSIVDFNGLLSIHTTYQLSPMSVDEFKITEAELTDEQSLALLQTEIGELDYSTGVYAIDALPVADTLGSYSVAYAVSSELTDVVAIDATTGVVTVTDVFAAVTGTITATITDGDGVVQGDPIVINVTIKASVVEPDAVSGKTLADLTAVEASDFKMVKYTGVTGIVSNLKDGTGSAYGNFDVAGDAAGTDKFVVYGASATLGSIKFDAHKGSYYFSNPKDFLTNEFTKTIKADDEITFNAYRYAFGETNELSIEITAINGVSTAPVINKVELDSTVLGLGGSYADGTSAEYMGTTYGFIQTADYGSGIQMRTKNGINSAFFNTTAFDKAIDTITFNITAGKTDTYGVANDAIVVGLGTSAVDSTVVTGDSVMAVNGCEVGELTLTLDVDASAGNTFFSVIHTGSYTTYFSSVVITFAN